MNLLIDVYGFDSAPPGSDRESESALTPCGNPAVRAADSPRRCSVRAGHRRTYGCADVLLTQASVYVGKRRDAHGCEGDGRRSCGGGDRVRAVEGAEHRDPTAPGTHLRRRDPAGGRMASPSPCAAVAGDLLLLRARARRDRPVLLAGRAAGAAPAFRGAPPRRTHCDTESLHRGPTRCPRLGRPPTPRASTRIEAAPPDRRVRAQGNECRRRDVLHACRYVVLGLRARSDDRAARGDRAGVEARESQADLPRDRPPARLLHPPEVLD